MKKKIMIFIGLLTLIVSFSFITHKPKALDLYIDYDAIVVGWEDGFNVYITVFDVDGTHTNLYNRDNILNEFTMTPLLTNEFNDEVGIKIKASQVGDNGAYLYGVIVDDTPTVIYETKYISLNKMFRDGDNVDLNLMYIGNGISNFNEPLLYLVDGSMNYYSITKDLFLQNYNSIYPLSNYYDNARDIVIPLETGSTYNFKVNLNIITPKYSPAISYEIGHALALEDLDATVNSAYNRGFDNAMKEIEFIKEQYRALGKKELEPYINFLEDTILAEYTRGYNKGYETGLEDIVLNGEYQTGYNKGYEKGFQDKQVENESNFYNGIEKWLVPAIIVVLVGGGIIAFRKKQKEG